MTFDAAAVNAVFDDIESVPMTLGVFERVNGHEPKSAPGTGLTCAVWMQDIRPVGRASGLAATSGLVTFNARLYTSFIAPNSDQIDPQLMTACTTLLGAYSAGFTLGGDVRNIDLLGMYGQAMGAVAGYLTQDSKLFRIMTITIPVVVDDLWIQEA